MGKMNNILIVSVLYIHWVATARAGKCISEYRPLTCHPPKNPPPQPCDSCPCVHADSCVNDACDYHCLCSSGWKGTICDICDPVSADVAFILDVSYSSGETTFQQQKQFILDFINRVDIGPDDFQIAVVTFSFLADVPLSFNHHSNRETLIDAINALEYPTKVGPSFLEYGIQATREWVFDVANGSRANAYKFAVVLTDGLASNIIDVKNERNLLQLQFSGVKVISIATGNSVLHSGLLTVASDYSEENVYFLSDTDSHDRIINDMDIALCRECNSSYSDILFLFDSSKGSPVADQLKAVMTIINTLNVSSETVRISFVQFNDKIQSISLFNENTTPESLKIQIQNSINYGGTPNFTKPLDYANTEGFNAEKGSRAGSRRIMIIVSSLDFEITNSDEEIIQNLKNNDVIVVAIGTDSKSHKLNFNNMKTVASDPAFVFRITQYSNADVSVVKCLKNLAEYVKCNNM